MAKRVKGGRGLTELEAVVLLLMGRRQPVSAYAVRVALERTPNARFSGSAGAVYPAIRRLEGAGLVESVASPQGRRPGRVLRVTRKGRSALARWAMGPMDAREMFAHDPLRVRAAALDLLTARERRAWFARAERCVREQMALVEAYAEAERGEGGAAYSRLVHEHVKRALEGTLGWVREAGCG